MPIHASGISGQVPPVPADIRYFGEVFVDDSGNYIGDFSGGVGVDGETPLGWAHGTSSYYSGAVNWASPGGLTGLFNDFWGNPSDHGNQTIAPVLFEVPTLRAMIVADATGPPGFENKNACLLRGAGAPGIFTWVGPDASLLTGPTLIPGSGWAPAVGSTWCFSGWFRLEDDTAGEVGLSIGFTGAKYAYGTGGTPTFSGNNPLALTQEWQQLSCQVGWSWSSGPALPVIELVGGGFDHSELHTIDYGAFGHIPLSKLGSWEFADYHWGGVLMKELHLWTCQMLSGPRHLKTRA